MSASHNSGSQRGSRVAARPTVLTFPIDYSMHASGTAYKLVTFKVTAQKPLLIRTNIVQAVADNSATSAVVSVGTASGGAQWHSAYDLKAGSPNGNQNNALGGAGQWIQYNPASTNVTSGVLPVWMTVTRVGTPTAGRAYLVIEVAEINVKKQSSGSAAL